MRILQAVTTAAAVCLLYDCRFLHLLLSHKRIKLRIKLFPQSTKHTLVLYPTGDSITRGNGESTKKATAEIEPTDFWGTSGSVHRTQRLFFFRRKPRTLLIPLITEQSCWIPEVSARVLQRELCSSSALSRGSSRDHAEKWWWEEEKDEEATEQAKRLCFLIPFQCICL